LQEFIRHLGAAEDVVPDFVNHLLSRDVANTLLPTEEIYQQVSWFLDRRNGGPNPTITPTQGNPSNLP
jgi:hypothetical protein